jgi:hypothetical protein
MLPKVQENVKEWTLTLPSELPLWELESQWTPKSSEGDFKGQNSLSWRVPYIIKKLLERRCLKWALMTHLGTWITSYGQKKGRESNWQFDSRPLKVGNRPDSLAFRWFATYLWKVLNESYNFVLDFISIGGLHTKLWVSKVAGIPILGISWLSLGSPRTKWHLGAGPMAKHRVYYKGEDGGFPQVRAVVSLVSPCLPVHQKCSNYALTNLLFGLCRSMWIIELLVNLPSPHPGVPARPSTPEVLRARECAPIPSPSAVFTFGLVMSPSRSLGGASFLVLHLWAFVGEPLENFARTCITTFYKKNQNSTYEWNNKV